MYNPYAKGRWYRIFMESDGSSQTIVDSDLTVSLSGNNVKMPAGFHVVDSKFDINSIEHDGVVSIIVDVMAYADGCQGISGPAPKAFDYAYIYVFGYFNE